MMFYIYHLNIDVFYIVFLKLFFVVDLFYFFHFFNNFIFALIFELTFEYLNLILFGSIMILLKDYSIAFNIIITFNVNYYSQ